MLELSTPSAALTYRSHAAARAACASALAMSPAGAPTSVALTVHNAETGMVTRTSSAAPDGTEESDAAVLADAERSDTVERGGGLLPLGAADALATLVEGRSEARKGGSSPLGGTDADNETASVSLLDAMGEPRANGGASAVGDGTLPADAELVAGGKTPGVNDMLGAVVTDNTDGRAVAES